MSFSSEVKQELLHTAEQQERCCSEAQLYGLLLFGYSFTAREISLRTESQAIANFVSEQLHNITLTQAQVQRVGRKWELSVPHPEDRLRALERFGHAKNETSRRFVRENFACDHCVAAFLRGVFLVCATISAPQRQYHLEFYVSYKKLAQELALVLEEVHLPPKLCQRKGVWLLYYKHSEQIEDVLIRLGAQVSMLKIANTKMEKDMRNNVNRVINFEMANISRASTAAVEQLRAIAAIARGPGLESLPENLREAALLRQQNPEASLQELCDLATQPITRSGMNHRLKKLQAISAQL